MTKARIDNGEMEKKTLPLLQEQLTTAGPS